MSAIGIIVTEFGTITIDEVKTPQQSQETTPLIAGDFNTILPPGIDIPLGVSLKYSTQEERTIMLPLIFQTINAQLQSMNLAFMRDAILDIKERASNQNQGLFTSSVCSTCDDERALLIASLSRSGDLDGILAEKDNPTPPADFYPSHSGEGLTVTYPALGVSSGSTNTSGTSSNASGNNSGGTTNNSPGGSTSGGSIVIGPV